MSVNGTSIKLHPDTTFFRSLLFFSTAAYIGSSNVNRRLSQEAAARERSCSRSNSAGSERSKRLFPWKVFSLLVTSITLISTTFSMFFYQQTLYYYILMLILIYVCELI